MALLVKYQGKLDLPKGYILVDSDLLLNRELYDPYNEMFKELMLKRKAFIIRAVTEKTIKFYQIMKAEDRFEVRSIVSNEGKNLTIGNERDLKVSISSNSNQLFFERNFSYGSCSKEVTLSSREESQMNNSFLNQFEQNQYTDSNLLKCVLKNMRPDLNYDERLILSKEFNYPDILIPIVQKFENRTTQTGLKSFIWNNAYCYSKIANLLHEILPVKDLSEFTLNEIFEDVYFLQDNPDEGIRNHYYSIVYELKESKNNSDSRYRKLWIDFFIEELKRIILFCSSPYENFDINNNCFIKPVD